MDKGAKPKRRSTRKSSTNPAATNRTASQPSDEVFSSSPKETCLCGEGETPLMIECSHCNQWWHYRCVGLTKKEFEKHLKNSELPFACAICSIKNITNPNVCSELREILRNNSKSVGILETVQSTSTPSEESQPHQPSSSNIVIIDGISNPRDYKDSATIKKEVNSLKPQVRIEHAYSLPAGGVALHLRDSESKDQALSDWPEGSFGSKQVKAHQTLKVQPKFVVVVKNVDTKLLETDIQNSLAAQVNEPVCVCRLHSNRTNGPLPIIKVTSSEATYKSFLKDGVKILGKTHSCTPNRNYKIVRCYNCQTFGHISKTCNHIHKCAVCSLNHPPNQPSVCTSRPKCANCEGAHPAYSTQCPVFKKTLQLLQARYDYLSQSAAGNLASHSVSNIA